MLIQWKISETENNQMQILIDDYDNKRFYSNICINRDLANRANNF